MNNRAKDHPDFHQNDFFPQKELKAWGRVVHIFGSTKASVSNLEMNAGFRCSLHRHQQRYNMFAVQTGSILVESWGLDGEDLQDAYPVTVGEVYTVEPMVYHRFRVLSSGLMTEVYWPVEGGICDINDIDRLDVGGEDDIVDAKRVLAEYAPLHKMKRG